MVAPLVASIAWELFYGKTHWWARCWKLSPSLITNTYYWTEHGRPLVLFDGQEYSPATGGDSTAGEDSGGLEPGNKEFRGFTTPNDLEGLTGDDLRAGVLNGAVLDEYKVDYRTPWLAPIQVLRFFVKSATFDGTLWQLECEGMNYELSDRVGGYWGPSCPVELFSKECGADILTFTDVSTIDNVINDKFQFEVTAPLQTQVNGWASDGRIYYNAGANQGGAYNIKDWIYPGPSGAGFAEVRLHQQTPRSTSPGDTLTIYPGCSHWITDCSDKFGNIENYQGFPYIPGGDFARRGIDPKI